MLERNKKKLFRKPHLSAIPVSLQPERTRSDQQTITMMFSCTPKMTKMWRQFERKTPFFVITFF